MLMNGDAMILENPMYKQGFLMLVVIVAALSYIFKSNTVAAKASKDPMELDLIVEQQHKDDYNNDIELENNNAQTIQETELFKKFKRNYLMVYALVIMSDWLQGPFVYVLYKSYGYDVQEIAILFVAGFLSSAVFGTVIGSVADRFGRKFMCQFFCLVYAVSCFSKLSDTFTILMFGRITGGIATSLLFSVFEAWMVSEFYSRNFPDELLSEIFSWSTYINGLVAIASGVLANSLVDVFGKTSFGYVMPFMAAIVILAISAVLISVTWKENYGSATSSGKSNISDAIHTIRTNYPVFAVGCMQCFFEAAMYTFVFIWSPALEKAKDVEFSIPFGIAFASFMVSIMIGSILYRVALSFGKTNEVIAQATFTISFITFLICSIFSETEWILFVGFNVFEMCCGLYFPSLGSMRGKLIPENTRATIMNVFRVPLNLIVVASLLRVDVLSSGVVFALSSACNLVCLVVALKI